MMAARREFVDDRPEESDTSPPNHGKNTHETAQFLEWVARLDRDPDVTELSYLYAEWRRRQGEASRQAELTEVSDR